MKIIVSTKALYATLNEALWDNITEVIYTGRSLKFHTEDCDYELSCDSKEKTDCVFSYNPEKWTSARRFLKQLPEQPIVVQIEEDYLVFSQFEMNF
jgi:hypothetical protein